MIPLLLISSDTEAAEHYVNDLLLREGIKSYEVHRLYKTLSTVTIEQIRGLSNILARSSYRQAAIIYDFDTAKKEAQNAFLKTLEESSEHHLIILIVSHEHLVLPTIRSRCTIKKIDTFLFHKDEHFSLFDASQEHLIAYLTQTTKINRERVITIIDNTLHQMHTQIAHDPSQFLPNTSDFYKDLITTKRFLVSNNLNPEYSLDHLIISLWKKRD
ncbi:hypothetical protein A2957_02130 [Candidatus Roizmanbacteria bacterium RIFCSPLOWO2_01_FULL_38_11]|uniref:DNA polymerase III delta N-terminal domain-containing protein n=1 Tax=Candidatus Roizmanbacteria bacterium RIFCSPLOWO2_01_FULL_38_11 TaxID=1802060 RepID=A0A1F7IP74_9BACT|nr:MAG: hypothetical protein A2957_02130 [Candidatus Roizmanbacteria bacterium RIFCSPLOWO2_01_FULL_38_11]